MNSRLVRFGSQWALVGVIFFYTVGTTMIVRHMERIVTPTSASGSERTLVKQQAASLRDFQESKGAANYDSRPAAGRRG